MVPYGWLPLLCHCGCALFCSLCMSNVGWSSFGCPWVALLHFNEISILGVFPPILVPCEWPLSGLPVSFMLNSLYHTPLPLSCTLCLSCNLTWDGLHSIRQYTIPYCWVHVLVLLCRVIILRVVLAWCYWPTCTQFILFFLYHFQYTVIWEIFVLKKFA